FHGACAGRKAKPHALIGEGFKGDRTHARAGARPHQLRRPGFLALSPPLLRAVHGLLACHVIKARGRHRLYAVRFQQLPPPLPPTATSPNCWTPSSGGGSRLARCRSLSPRSRSAKFFSVPRASNTAI